MAFGKTKNNYELGIMKASSHNRRSFLKSQAILGVGALAAGILVYAVACHLLRSEELKSAINLFRRRLGKGNR